MTTQSSVTQQSCNHELRIRSTTMRDDYNETWYELITCFSSITAVTWLRSEFFYNSKLNVDTMKWRERRSDSDSYVTIDWRSSSNSYYCIIDCWSVRDIIWWRKIGLLLRSTNKDWILCWQLFWKMWNDWKKGDCLKLGAAFRREESRDDWISFLLKLLSRLIWLFLFLVLLLFPWLWIWMVISHRQLSRRESPSN